jgi:CheY-like chemotaxis protein
VKGTAAGGGRPEQILVVEDEKIARDSLARMLRRRNFEVIVAENGSLAIRKAEAGSVNVVLMDIVLGREEGEMDGIEAATLIQRARPLTSIIFVTAYAGEQAYRRRVRESGIRVGGWLEKPVRVDDLVGMISREMKKSAVRRNLTEAQAKGVNPWAHLAEIATKDPSLSPDLLGELLEEFGGKNEAES